MRLAWHDSGTYDAGIAAWPACGGANGSIRFGVELAHNANAGLIKGVTVYLAPIAKRHPSISYADLLQLASATAVAHAGGPVIPMRYGRVDAPTEAQCPESGRLPDAAAPFGGDTPMAAPDAASHLRAVFYRMGFNDAEIVALSGAHTIGRAFKERSGTTPHGCAPVPSVSPPGPDAGGVADTVGALALRLAATPTARSTPSRAPAPAPATSKASAWCVPALPAALGLEPDSSQSRQVLCR